MIEQIGRFIGMAAADIAHLVRKRPQLAPCTVDWDQEYETYRASTMSRYFSAEPQRLMDDECCNQCDHGCFAE